MRGSGASRKDFGGAVMRTILALSFLCFATACAGYRVATTNFRSHPELRNVRLYSGEPDARGEELAQVSAEYSGRGSCQDATSRVMTDLLAEARALGGNAVKDVRFKGRYNWQGRLACKGGGSQTSSVFAQAIGTAVRLPGPTTN